MNQLAPRILPGPCIGGGIGGGIDRSIVDIRTAVGILALARKKNHQISDSVWLI